MRLVLAGAALVCIVTALTAPLNRDEHMYLGATALVGSGHQIYEDFAFFQTPYSVWLYRAAEAITPGHWTLLPARLLKAATGLLTVCILFTLARRLGAGPLLASGLVLLLYQNGLIREMAGLARNYDFAQLCILGALMALLGRQGEAAGPGRLFVAGALASAAVGFKLTYAPLSAVVIGWIVVAGPRLDRFRSAALVGGIAAGLVPLAVCCAGLDWPTLRFNLLEYHYLNAELHALEGYAPHASIGDRMARGVGVVLAPDHRPLVGMALAALILGLAPWPGSGARRPARAAVLATALLLAALVIGVVPRPVQTFYFAPVFFGLVLLVATLSDRLSRAGQRSLVLLCGILVTVDVVIQAPAVLERSNTALHPGQWTPVRVHAGGTALARAVGDRTGPVATTHPIYALEAGLEIYPELGTAEFAWRSGSLVSAADRVRFRVASGEDLEELLADREPSAALTELGARWDGPLQQWAINAGWHEFSPAPAPLRIWVP